MFRTLRHVELGSSKFWAGVLTALLLSSMLLDVTRWISTAFTRPLQPSEIFFPCSRAAFPLEGDKSFWHSIKILPPPADCRVQGFMIEALEPELNFRRAYTLGYARSVEDRTQVLPFMRATQDLSLRTKERRVLLDLGPGDFESSVKWFLNWYPLDFTEVHVVEADPNGFQDPVAIGATVPDLYEQLQKSENFTERGRLGIPEWMLERIYVHRDVTTAKNSTVSSKAGSGRNITQFIGEELQLTADDAVIVKMDIAGDEWDIFLEWMDKPELAKVIDEIWVKMFYNDPTVRSLGWKTHRHNREDVTGLLNRMRQCGFFIHYWS